MKKRNNQLRDRSHAKIRRTSKKQGHNKLSGCKNLLMQEAQNIKAIANLSAFWMQESTDARDSITSLSMIDSLSLRKTLLLLQQLHEYDVCNKLFCCLICDLHTNTIHAELIQL